MCFLIWVDDVLSFAEGASQQRRTLEMVNEFAVKHKLKWGADKCNVMSVGKNAFVKEKWLAYQYLQILNKIFNLMFKLPNENEEHPYILMICLSVT